MSYAYALCGRIASGKSTVSRMLKERHGWDLVSFGGFVRLRARDAGLDPDRRTLQELGQQLFTELGARGILEAARAACGAQSDVQVIDGIRHVDVWSAVKSAYDGATLFFLDSPVAQRYDRYRTRHGYADEEFSLAQFADLDRQPIELGVGELAVHADTILDATLPLPELVEEVERLIGRTGAHG